jgi:hypothetical protein
MIGEREMTEPLRSGTFEFTFVLSGAPTDEQLDLLFEVGGDDATPELNPKANTGCLHFARQAPTLAEALVSALRTVEAVGLRAVAVESDDLVTLREIAARTGRTYEGVRLLATGQRGPGAFPPPMASSGSALYSWAQVADWFDAVFGPDAPALPSEFDRLIAAADHLIRARALAGSGAGVLTGLLSA